MMVDSPALDVADAYAETILQHLHTNLHGPDAKLDADNDPR